MRRLIPAAIGLAPLLLLAACSAAPIEKESAGGMRVTAELLEQFDGYCGVGVRVDNAGTDTLRFPNNDIEVFQGSGWVEWNLPFQDIEPGADVRGYAVDAEFPSALEPGTVATDAFVVNCDDNSFTLTVISNSGSAAFDFLSPKTCCKPAR